MMQKSSASRLAFIGCSPRSGSTLLTRILDSHSRIAAPCEIGIPKYFEGDAEKYDLVKDKYKQICSYYQADFEQCYRDPRILFDRIRAREGKECLVIKDPRQSLFLQTIVRDFPDARFICLVRDVRAVAMSVMFRDRPLIGFIRWYEYNLAIWRSLQKVDKQQSFLVRYEDMLNDPERSIGKLVEFLGYQFEPPMLNYGNFAHADDSMRLWSGTPAESRLQSALQHGSISKEPLMSRVHFSEPVVELYKRSPEIQKLNQLLGYT
jgi:hypothetical protein